MSQISTLVRLLLAVIYICSVPVSLALELTNFDFVSERRR